MLLWLLPGFIKAQWSGSTGISGNIYREGGVEIHAGGTNYFKTGYGMAGIKISETPGHAQVRFRSAFASGFGNNSENDFVFEIGQSQGHGSNIGDGTEVFRIGLYNTLIPTGSLGIGTSTTSARFHINSAVERETFRIYKYGNTTNYLSIWQGTGGAAIDPIGTGLLYLGYDQATNVVMGAYSDGSQSAGKVGIGTTNPSSKLTVVSPNLGSNDATIRLMPSGGGTSSSSSFSLIDLFSTFDNYPSDQGSRRTASIKAGFSEVFGAMNFCRFMSETMETQMTVGRYRLSD